MAAYVAAAKASLAADPATDLRALWQQHVIDPYWDAWAAGQHNEARLREEMAQPITDLDGLAGVAAALAASNVEAVVRGAYDQIRQRLPYHDDAIAICIRAADPQDRGLVADLNGVVGATVGGNTLLTINPAGQDWPSWVQYVLAHERHHSAWGYHYYYLQGGARRDLLVSLISEGTADSFARLLCPELLPRWIAALSPEEEARQWQAIRPLLDQPDWDGELYRRFFFGNAELGTPAFTGYTLGYRIVQGYLKNHPEAGVYDWTLAAPETILAGSGYA